MGLFTAGLMRLSFILQVRRPKGDTLEEMGKPLLFHDIEKKFGAPWNFYHRVDAHNSLKELATDPELPGKPAVIKLASQVVDLDCDSGVLTLKDGMTVQKDLVVVADGQHVRASVHAEHLPHSPDS
jgi:2-polyprenyl-6-methoxyphenol hydroxylase-like FAD-dependent oxidoreductase